MKKFLALLLALVMTMSLVTVGASAKTAFTDDASISADAVEAVEVLSAMGVIDGYKDGSFKPQTVLNRAAGTKFIAYLMLGEDKADGLSARGTMFSDVPADYALAPYVEYCASLGIVDGYGNGTFGPKNALTQAAFGKMLLTALGYDSETEELTGAGWQARTYALGVKTGVYGDDGDVKADCTREAAAKLALGALDASFVEYGKVIKNNNTFVTAAGAYETGETLAEFYGVEKLNAIDVFGRPGHTWEYDDFYKFYMNDVVKEYKEEVEACDVLVDLDVAKNDMKTEFDVVYFNVFEDDADCTLGRNFILSHKNCEDYVCGGQGVLTQVFDLADIDEDEYEDCYEVVEIETYLALVTDVETSKDHKDVETTLEVYIDDEEIEIVINEDLGYKEDDYVLVNLSWLTDDVNTNNGFDLYIADDIYEGEYDREDVSVKVVGLADSKEGELTGATKSTTKVDKAAYDDAKNFFLGETMVKDATNYEEEYVFYFDSYGNMIGAVEAEAAALKYAVIDKVWYENVKGVKTAFANLVGFDGKSIADEVKVEDNEVAGVDVSKYADDNEELYNDIYTYTVNDDDEYSFEVYEAYESDPRSNEDATPLYGYAATELDYDSDEAIIYVDLYTFDLNALLAQQDPYVYDDDSFEIEMNKNTTVLVKDLNGEYKVFSGTELDDLVSFESVAYTMFDEDDANKGYAEYVYITEAIYETDSVTGFVFATNDNINWEEGFELITVWVGDKDVTVKVESDSSGRVIPLTGFYKFTNKVDEDGVTVVVERFAFDGEDGYELDAIAKAEGGVIDFVADYSVKDSDKIAYYEIDDEDETVTAITYDDIVEMVADADEEGDGPVDCYLVFDDNDKLTAVYVGDVFWD